MFNLESFINLPLAWAALLTVAIILYVILDGFGLGVGIIFPFAPSDECRDKMMNSIAPFWDGNETWLVLGGGGLFAAFPMAFSIIMPAFYMPILFMLIALVFRGVSFEFRFKASLKYRKYWDLSFHYGSLVAAFMQGVILGAFIQGIKVKNFQYAGNSFDWLSAFSITTGLAVVCGYVLLGSTWIILKTQSETQKWAYKCAEYILLYVLFFMGVVSIWVPFIDKDIYTTWFSWPNIGYLGIIPLLVIIISYKLYKALETSKEKSPFFLSVSLFLLGFLGLGICTWPFIVPRSIKIADAAASPESQSLMLVAALLILPIILAYTSYSYYVFKGKSKSGSMY